MESITLEKKNKIILFSIVVVIALCFVTTILTDPDDREKPLQKRLEEYQKRLFLLAE